MSEVVDSRCAECPFSAAKIETGAAALSPRFVVYSDGFDPVPFASDAVLEAPAIGVSPMDLIRRYVEEDLSIRNEVLADGARRCIARVAMEQCASFAAPCDPPESLDADSNSVTATFLGSSVDLGVGVIGAIEDSSEENAAEFIDRIRRVLLEIADDSIALGVAPPDIQQLIERISIANPDKILDVSKNMLTEQLRDEE